VYVVGDCTDDPQAETRESVPCHLRQILQRVAEGSKALDLDRVFDTYEVIIEAACEAWNKLMAQPQAITSIGMRDWAHFGQN
jgi:hypothetical protein